ncbi:MAG: hypothetical protein KF723_08835 [Rhizobiaceae bacterium]|nr:hypothetical protein [Rhizobiaceae bacterium]
MIRRFLVAACSAFVFASPALADRVGLGDPVAGHPEASYLDLVRLMLPDAAPAEDLQFGATVPRGLRHIHTAYGDDENLDRGLFFGAEAEQIQAGGRERTIVLVDFGASPGVNGFAVLGLFGFDGGAPRLLDAVNVALDRDTFLRDRLPLGSGETLLVTASYHHNSSQGYAALAMIFVRQDRFDLIDTIWLISNRFCGWEQVEEPTITTAPGDDPFGQVTAGVTDTMTPVEGEVCTETVPPQPTVPEYRVTYRWDESSQNYLPDSDAFERLETLNENRY